MSRNHSERAFVSRPRSQAPMSVVPPPPASRSPLGEGSAVIVSATDRLSIVIELARLIQAVDAGADPGLRAMLARVSGFLPVGCSPKVAVDSAHRAEAEEQLIGEVAQDEDKRLAPAPCAMVCLLELAQAANLDEDAEGEAREWQECKQRKPDLNANEKHGHQRDRDEQHKQCLSLRHDQHVEGQCTLGERLESQPITLQKDLYES